MFPYVTVSLEISFLTFHGSSLPSFTLFLLLLLLVASSLAKDGREVEEGEEEEKKGGSIIDATSYGPWVEF